MRMTNEEAIEVINNRDQIMGYCESEKLSDALDMAIKALEQIEIWNATTKDRQIIAPKGTFQKIWEDEQQQNIHDTCKKCVEFSEFEQTRWIPCSERLPEREGWYLTSLGDKTYGGVDVDMYCKGWVKYGTHVLAWMPLPEPYKAESEEEE